jgi:hypothetical protein
MTIVVSTDIPQQMMFSFKASMQTPVLLFKTDKKKTIQEPTVTLACHDQNNRIQPYRRPTNASNDHFIVMWTIVAVHCFQQQLAITTHFHSVTILNEAILFKLHYSSCNAHRNVSSL